MKDNEPSAGLREQIDMAFASHNMLGHTQLIDNVNQIISTLLDTIQTDVLEGGLPEKPKRPKAYSMPANDYDDGYFDGETQAIDQTAATQSEKLRELKEKLL